MCEQIITQPFQFDPLPTQVPKSPWYVSRSFLYCKLLMITFFSTVVVRLASECPGKLVGDAKCK